MLTQQFKDTAHAISLELKRQGVDSYFDTYALLNLAQAAVDGANMLTHVVGHEQFVTAAIHSGVVMDYVRAGQKINAIKALRERTSAGLKEAKEAVEDTRVWQYAPTSL